MNNQAIGETTVSLKTLLINALGDSYVVTLFEPWSDFGNSKGVNLYLYKVETNAQMKNLDWFGTRDNLTYNNHPPLSLDLYYMLTPFTPKASGHQTDEAEAHRILGMVMQVFHEYPVLNDIHSSFFDADNDDHLPSDLKKSLDKIKVTLQSANLEEMSKIWSMGNHPYKLSVCYYVSVIQIEPSIPSTIAKEVEKINLDVSRVKGEVSLKPFIENIKLIPANPGTELIMKGKNLTGRRIKINIGSRTQIIKKNQNPEELKFTVPADILPGDYNIIVTINEQVSNTISIQVNPV